MESQKILAFVNKILSLREDICKLIGENPLQIIKHRYHVNFMSTVLDIRFLIPWHKGLLWNYKIYLNHGFFREYFSLELETWIKAIEECMVLDFQSELIKVYEWLFKRQAKMMQLSEEMRIFDLEIRDEWRECKAEFLIAVLAEDNEKALNIAKRYIHLSGNVTTLYTEIVQPLMYEIGSLWESGKISMPEKHLTTSIVSRILAVLI